MYVTVESPAYKAVSGSTFTDNAVFDSVLLSHSVTYYEQALPFAKNPELLKLHEVRATSNLDSLISYINTHYSEDITNPGKFEVSADTALYDPADWQW